MNCSIIRKILLLSIFGILTKVVCFSQICYKYHENCSFGDWEFYYSRQSASALFEPNQRSSMRFFAKGNEKYYISICGEKEFKDIKFRLIEEGSPGMVIYDNSLDNYNSSITFINEESRNIIVEVTAPEIKSKKGGETSRYCIGVLIQFAEININMPKSGKTGFQSSGEKED